MNELIWVKIETTKGNDDVWSFKGTLERAVFANIVSNQLTTGYIKLSDVYWTINRYDNKGDSIGEDLYQYGKGELSVYHGELYLKIDHLVSIAPINGEEEIAKFTKSEKKHLSVVTPIAP